MGANLSFDYWKSNFCTKNNPNRDNFSPEVPFSLFWKYGELAESISAYSILKKLAFLDNSIIEWNSQKSAFFRAVINKLTFKRRCIVKNLKIS